MVGLASRRMGLVLALMPVSLLPATAADGETISLVCNSQSATTMYLSLDLTKAQVTMDSGATYKAEVTNEYVRWSAPFNAYGYATGIFYLDRENGTLVWAHSTDQLGLSCERGTRPGRVL